MTKSFKFAGTSLSSAVAAFFLATTTLTAPGCGPGEEPPEEVEYCEAGVAGCCSKRDHCGENAKAWMCSGAGSCIPLCSSSADCATGEVCEDAVCRPPGCVSDSECGSGQQCIGGTCQTSVAPASVASCVVLPEAALLVEGAAKSFSVVAYDADGKTLAYKGEVTWSTSAADKAAAAAGGAITGASVSGAVDVKASVGSVECAAAKAVNYAAASADDLRVVVADLNTQKPVAGATVTWGSESATTDADGIVTFEDVGAGPYTVSAFHNDYIWVTVVDSASKDLLLYTKTSVVAAPASFEGTMGPRAFDNLSDARGNLHLAIHGSSLAGNLMDLELSTLLGEMVETEITLMSPPPTVPLPQGTVLGAAETMIREDFTIVSSAGVRTLWALGGNAVIQEVLGAITPALDTSKPIDVGGIMAQLLPILGRLQSGAITGVKAESGKTVDLNVGGTSKLKLDSTLRLRLEASLPKLPTFQFGGKSVPFEGAIVLGGALHGSQGLVPLGLSAAIDKDQNGLIDNNEGAEGKISLRAAPLHSGLETSKHVGLALAASFGGLFGGEAAAGSPGLVLSGLIARPESLTFSSTSATPLNFGDSFLGVPSGADFDAAERTFSRGAAVEGASFHRLSLTNDEGAWYVYFPASKASFTVPSAPAGFDDRFDAESTGIVHSVRLTGGNYDSVVEFSGSNLDDFTPEINAFSVFEIK